MIFEIKDETIYVFFWAMLFAVMVWAAVRPLLSTPPSPLPPSPLPTPPSPLPTPPSPLSSWSSSLSSPSQRTSFSTQGSLSSTPASQRTSLSTQGSLSSSPASQRTSFSTPHVAAFFFCCAGILVFPTPGGRGTQKENARRDPANAGGTANAVDR